MKVLLTVEIRKQLEKIPRNQRNKIYRKLEVLEVNPGLGKKLEGELAGRYTFRAWPYRIIYVADKINNRVLIVSIAHRQGVYK